MLDTEHIVYAVKCKFNSQKCYSVDCCFVLGCWVQCHVLCQQWCCACWSWWNTQSYEACCTGDTQLGSVNYSLQEIFGVVFENFWWTNRVWQWQVDNFWWFWYEISKSSETQSHMRPGVVLETLDLAQTWLGMHIPLGNCCWECFLKLIFNKHAWHCCSVKQIICSTKSANYLNESEYLHAKCYSKVTMEIGIHS